LERKALGTKGARKEKRSDGRSLEEKALEGNALGEKSAGESEVACRRCAWRESNWMEKAAVVHGYTRKALE